jgi:hypothetical protein
LILSLKKMDMWLRPGAGFSKSTEFLKPRFE